MNTNPNRVAALVSVAAAVVTGVLIPLLGVVDNDIARAAVLGVLILSVTAIVVTWLRGWQKHEQNVALATGRTIDGVGLGAPQGAPGGPKP